MNDLLLIKKYYGEAMSHFCRELFPSLLEEDGLLFSLISSRFAYSKFLYDDIVANNLEMAFKKYIYNLIVYKAKKIDTDKTPYELLNEAGYTLYECKTEEEIQRFKKYYARGEDLCTFRGGRLDTCYVFFAVKKNVEQIKREDFDKPERQDLYGTSVISIQFSREESNFLSIKNRYNHTVYNPDATFGNDLDNIIPGLTCSFEKYYDFDIVSNNEDFEMYDYVLASDNKFYKYNYEIDNIYFCPNNLIIKNGVKIEKFKDKSRYFFIDYFIIDLKEKKLLDYASTNDMFYDLNCYLKTINIRKEKDYYELTLETDSGDITIIKVDKQSRIIYYKNDNIKEINNFFKYNTNVEVFEAYNLEKIGDFCLHDNICIKKMYLPKVTEIASSFLKSNKMLEEFDAPNLITIGAYSLYGAENLTIINVPNLEETGDYFLATNIKLEELSFPSIKIIGEHNLAYNKSISKIDIGSVQSIGNYFLAENKKIIEINLLNVKTIGDNFMHWNNSVKVVNLPNVETIGNNFLDNNTILHFFIAPKLYKAKNNFLSNNKDLRRLDLPKLTWVGYNFLFHNELLSDLNLPYLKEVDRDFMYWNDALVRLELPFLTKIKPGFMGSNENSLKELIVPLLRRVPSKVLEFNRILEYIELNAEEIDEHFLDNHPNKNEIIDALLKTNKWQKSKTFTK